MHRSCQGTLHNVNASTLKHAAQQWSPWFQLLERNNTNAEICTTLGTPMRPSTLADPPVVDLEERTRVGVLIGGNCSGYKLTSDQVTILCDNLVGLMQVLRTKFSGNNTSAIDTGCSPALGQTRSPNGPVNRSDIGKQHHAITLMMTFSRRTPASVSKCLSYVTRRVYLRTCTTMEHRTACTCCSFCAAQILVAGQKVGRRHAFRLSGLCNQQQG
jgi:hypothetical protein